MGKAAVTKAFEDINAALAVLNAEAAGYGSEPFSDADPLAGLADGCLEILAGAAGVQAMVSGLVANAAGTYADTARAAAPPDSPVQAQEMAITAEIGSLLALSDRAAGVSCPVACPDHVPAPDIGGLAQRNNFLASRQSDG